MDIFCRKVTEAYLWLIKIVTVYLFFYYVHFWTNAFRKGMNPLILEL